jgi:hypothetical protein
VSPSSVSAIVAALDLKLVRGLRVALQDDIRHGVHPLGPAPQPQFLPRQRIEPEPFIEPRLHIRPEPYFEPRPIHRPEPTFAPGETLCPPSSPLPEDPGGKCPIEPPWKVRPWEQPVPIKREVKVVVVRPDIVSKGSLIDFFC